MTSPLGRARHPRSRAERSLLSELQRSLNTAVEICESSTAGDVHLLNRVATEARTSSTSTSRPSLLHASPPMTGAGLKSRGQPFMGAPRAGLSIEDDAVLMHYGVQQ